MSPTAERIAARVRAEMAARRLSHTSLANHLGVHQTYVSRRMTGDVPWSAAEIVEVAEFMDVPPSDLLPEPKTSRKAAS